MSYFSTHNHSMYSNTKVLDSINRPKEMIQYANDIGLAGICISEHENVSSSVKFISEFKKLKKEGKIREDFRIGLGNEIYLMEEENLEELKQKIEDRIPVKFYHFLLLAKNQRGHEQIRHLSSLAWEKMFSQYGQERTPTFKSTLREIVKKGDIVGTTACLGGFLPQTILKAYNSSGTEREKHYDKAVEFIEFCVEVFGKDNFYLEVQPSNNPEQIVVNKALINLSKQFDIGYTIATDGHFLKKDDRHIHKIYLQSRESEREVDAFYESTYIMSEDEVKDYLLTHLTEEQIQIGFANTIKIMNEMEEYDLFHPIVIPQPFLENTTVKHLWKDWYEKYEYIKKFAYSEYEVDLKYLQMVEEGLVRKILKPRNIVVDSEEFHVYLNRINIEMRELWLISEKLNDRMSGYYVLTSQVVDMIWEKADSMTGISRGSAGGYLTTYLLDITELNPIDYNLPHFRHLTAERPELPDIDIDCEKSRRLKIIEVLKDTYGEKKVLNIATFSSEGAKSALLSAARGMGIDINQVNYLTSLIPVERGFTWSLSDCYNGNIEKERKPVRELVKAVEQYPELKEVSLKIEGLIKGKSQHASGVYVFKDDYYKYNAMMKTSSGLVITQLDMKDSDYMGGLKLDLLTVEGIDKIRKCMDMMILEGYMEAQTVNSRYSLRETYRKYLHPDVLEYKDENMWKQVAENKILDLFQFDSATGGQCVKKTKPKSVLELSEANTIMRLMAEGTEQPIDKLARFKEDINLWYQEMATYDLTADEVKVLERHLAPVFGVSSTQEALMLMLMDKDIGNFSIQQANDARKVVGKKLIEEVPRIKKLLFENTPDVSNNLKVYVWNTQIMPQMAYSFSSLHSVGYSLIALQNMNLSCFYPSAFWATACLTVVAEADEESENNKNTDYGKISTAIAKIKSQGIRVLPPDINKSRFGFYPDVETNSVLFGLKGIDGIGDDVAHSIIANRPYNSYEDAYEKLYKSGIIKKSGFVKLIKSGAFDALISREDCMMNFIFNEVPLKDKLTTANLSKISQYGIIPKEYEIYEEVFNFRKVIKKKVVRKINKPKDNILGLNDREQAFLIQHFSDVEHSYENNLMLISEKEFDKKYKEVITPLTDLLSQESFIKEFNKAQFYELWETLASGNKESWEIESIVSYSDKHELDYVNLERYGIKDFFSINPNPVVVYEKETKTGLFKKLQTVTLAGTVIEKNKTKHTFSLLTPTGVVTCKTYSGAFSHYDKNIVTNNEKEKSWFTRGNLLLVHGFRRDDQFILKTYNDSHMKHTINKIIGIDRETGEINLQSERLLD